VAELTVALILNALRKISEMDRLMRNGVWSKLPGSLLSGKNVAIIGFGRIGQKVAALLAPFGTNIKYHDIVDKGKAFIFEPILAELLRWADVVTLHCSPTKNAPILGTRELSLMKEDSILINTARGALIDENALYALLLEQPARYAALDVYQTEPYNGKLKTLTNVMLTPHIASAARETRIVMEAEAVDNCLRGLGLV
jgi:D-3-phosphoglycerate dehydrogenase